MADLCCASAFFFLKEAGKRLNDNGKICTVVTSLPGAFTPFYAAYAGTKAPMRWLGWGQWRGRCLAHDPGAGSAG